jgi:hypothetical protein
MLGTRLGGPSREGRIDFRGWGTGDGGWCLCVLRKERVE